MTNALSSSSQRSISMQWLALCALVPLLVFAAAFSFRSQIFRASSRSPSSAAEPEGVPITAAPTDINIGPEVLHSNVKRFGINLSGQTFYDSGQMLRNLVFRNPGFEGETWQSTLRCKSITSGSCIDDNPNSTWPNGFLDGASFEVLSGAAKASTGVIRASAAAGNGHGFTLTFVSLPARLAAGDFLLVRMEKPGNAQAGWWPSLNGGATLATELHDLSPHTPGKQALRVDASGSGQSATVNSYFDSTDGRSFLQLHGRYALRFRAKWLAGSRILQVHLNRGGNTFFRKDVPLSPSWQDFHFEFEANDIHGAVGTVGLTFDIQQSSVLLDDVELVSVGGDPTNSSAFRDEVVQTLRELHPGILRFMDNGTSFGSTLDDLLAPPLARRRGGSLVSSAESDDIPIGLFESLTLAHTIAAEPWYTLPATFSPEEMQHLIEFLAGPASTPYGAKRVALGQQAPWTTVFPTIHLEFGNEMWGTFPGASIAEPTAYGQRASTLFSAARSSPWFHTVSFDLISDAQGPNTWWTPHLLQASSQQDSIDFAPYLFGEFNDASSTEAIFGSMFAEPEQLDTTGYMAEQVKLSRNAAHPTVPTIYETNLGTSSSVNSAITQADIDRTVPSIGAGIAVGDHMLLMLRELGITTQCLFALPEYINAFNSPGGVRKTTPLWGSVVDMGGATNLRRPTYLALQLMNSAILAQELKAQLTGKNPTWNQSASTNDNIAASTPHLLQVFAFAGGSQRSVILLNLSRSSDLPVTFSGAGRPGNIVTESRLTSAHITDNNEHQRQVSITRRDLANFNAAQKYLLPPFSMTVLQWQVAP